ncbi:MAG: response regulator [Deltaproteobacteria bacterium]|nr:response regulator [Deltaproteobacteria bacterium]
MAKKILVVDDDPVIQRYLVDLLRDNGYEAQAAAGAKEAHDLVKQDKPDLITLDLEMPKEWGPQFYRKLTKDGEFKDIPVIVISGLTEIEFAINKAVACLNKPFDREELLTIVKRTIGE